MDRRTDGRPADSRSPERRTFAAQGSSRRLITPCRTSTESDVADVDGDHDLIEYGFIGGVRAIRHPLRWELDAVRLHDVVDVLDGVEAPRDVDPIVVSPYQK